MSEAGGTEDSLDAIAAEDVENTDEPGEDGLTRVPIWVQIIWVGIAALAFGFSLFQVEGSFPKHPSPTIISLGWFATAIVGIIVNSFEQVGFPGAKLAFRKRFVKVKKAAIASQDSVESLLRVVDKYAELLQEWTHCVVLLREHLTRYGTTVDKALEITARFCLERMEEAREAIAEQDERIRLSFWWFDEEAGGLRLVFSNDIRDDETLQHVFKPGSGLLGQCFIEDRTYNIEDAPSSSFYEKIRDNPEYRGLVLVPAKARTDGHVIGVLSMDREKREMFSDSAENIAEALANLVAFAISAYFDHPVEDEG